MRVWYKDAVDRPPPPSILAPAKMTSEREDLYRNFRPPVELIPLRKPPFHLLVDDSIPEDEDIDWAVRRLRLNCFDVPSIMLAKHIHQWLIATMWDNSPDATS